LAIHTCTAGGDTDSDHVIVNGGEPQNPLVPTNTNETNGGRIVDRITRRTDVLRRDRRPVLVMRRDPPRSLRNYSELGDTSTLVDPSVFEAIRASK
jgi:hypothetical protein